MLSPHALGVTLSLGTAFLWALSPLFWASAGRRIGSVATNLLRILLASAVLLLVVLPAYALLLGRWPAMPAPVQFGWMLLSGTAGLVIGDAFFFAAVVHLGPRRAVQVNTLAPVSAVLLGWTFLDEELAAPVLAGVALVLGAVAYIAFAERRPVPADDGDPPSTEPGHMSRWGLTCAICSAACVGMGTVLGRQAFRAPGPPFDPVVATVVRVAGACPQLWALALLRGTARPMLRHLRDRAILHRLCLGVLAGPVGGMLCYVTSMKLIPAGLVSTLTAMSPLVILPIVAVYYRARVRPGVYLATAAAVAGVALLFWDRR